MPKAQRLIDLLSKNPDEEISWLIISKDEFESSTNSKLDKRAWELVSEDITNSYYMAEDDFNFYLSAIQEEADNV